MYLTVSIFCDMGENLPCQLSEESFQNSLLICHVPSCLLAPEAVLLLWVSGLRGRPGLPWGLSGPGVPPHPTSADVPWVNVHTHSSAPAAPWICVQCGTNQRTQVQDPQLRAVTSAEWGQRGRRRLVVVGEGGKALIV